MARARNDKVDKARALYESGMPLIDIANKLDLPAGTIRSWKARGGWNCNATSKKCCNEEMHVLEKLDESGLTEKQKLFCLYYSKSFNATMAYKKAYGCSYATALTNGPALLGNARVRDEVIQLKKSRYSQALLASEDIFQKYMDIAFADITDYLDFGREEVSVMGPFGPIYEGKGKNKKPITREVNSVRFKESTEVDGSILSEVKQGKDGASIKLADRMRALEWIADHMDMATEEQRARIDALKAKAQLNDNGETEDDGFIEALAGKVDDIWQDE